MANADFPRQRLNWHAVLGYTGVIFLSVGVWGVIIRAAASLVK